MDRDVNEIIRSLIARIREKDFGLGFFIDVIALALWALTWLNSDPQVFSERADSLGSLLELHDELGIGEVPLSGPITSALIALVIKALVAKALEVIADSGLPAEVIDWIRQILESLQARV